MVGGVGGNSSMSMGAAGAGALGDRPIDTAGAAGAGGLLNTQHDEKEAQTAAKFGDVWKNIQSKYGAKPEKPREIKKTLGKDDFLKIMVTQMKQQDPTSPFKAEQMAAQMAQFASVEQLQNINQAMGKMANQNQPLERLAMANLIGKTVTVDRERFPHTEGQNESLSFALPRDASQVHVTILSDTGETVLDKDLGPQKKGTGKIEWDGKKPNTLAAKTGNYMYRVDARDEQGASMGIDTKLKARVVGISFQGAEPVFLVGDLKNPEKVAMRNIGEIDDDGAGSLLPGAQPLSSAVGGMRPQNNFISFQNGVGSGNLDSAQLPPDARAAIEKFQQQAAQAVAKPDAAPVIPQDKEKGFPNGLTDDSGNASANADVTLGERR